METSVLQVSVFGQFKAYTATSERFVKLMTAFPGFLPVSNQVINVDGINGKVETLACIQMNNQNAFWKIEIQPDRINGVFSPNSSGIDIKENIDKGISYIDTVCDSLEINKTTGFTRLAVNIQFADPTVNEKPCLPFVDKLPDYVSNHNELKEWTVSLNKQGSISLNNNDVETNEIMTCSLGTSRLDNSQFAVILITDINTTPNDLRERFGISNLQEFASYSNTVIHTMISSYLNK